MTVSQHARRGSWNVLLLLWIAMPGMAQSSAADPPSQVTANANRQMDAWGPIIDAASLQQALPSESIAIFDLGPQRKVFDKGHIPGAISIFWEDNFNRDGTFKSLDALQQLYAEKKVSPNQTVITYCNEGLHAAPP